MYQSPLWVGLSTLYESRYPDRTVRKSKAAVVAGCARYALKQRDTRRAAFLIPCLPDAAPVTRRAHPTAATCKRRPAFRSLTGPQTRSIPGYIEKRQVPGDPRDATASRAQPDHAA